MFDKREIPKKPTMPHTEAEIIADYTNTVKKYLKNQAIYHSQLIELQEELKNIRPKPEKIEKPEKSDQI